MDRGISGSQISNLRLADIGAIRNADKPNIVTLAQRLDTINNVEAAVYPHIGGGARDTVRIC